jgi:hypothetical protein
MRLLFAPPTGANKALHAKLIADTQAVESLNQKPGRGDFRPWRVPLQVAALTGSIQTIYRMGRDTKSDSNYWLQWGTRVHAVRGFDSQDTTERTYYTGDGIPKWTDNTIALAGSPKPVAWRQLGVPAPTTAPTLTASGGTSANNETRYSVYTFVTNKGEESAPSPISLELNCKEDDTVTIASIEAAPTGQFTIDRVRVYVTQSGDKGDTDFFFLREIAAGISSTTDDLRLRGDALETLGWLMPPADLKHLTALWNNVLAGVSAGGFRFCEPNAAYAWPLAYEILPPDSRAVAIGTWGQKALGLTTGKPLLITGSSPDGYDQLPIEGPSCSAPAAVVSFTHGVAWPGEDGLAYIGDLGAKLLTAGLLTRDDWQAMNPSTMVAGIYEGLYLCFYTDSSPGAVRRGFLIDPISPVGILFLETGYAACFFDQLTDALYVLDGTNVKKWDAGAELMTATWRSKEFTTAAVNFPWLRVDADAYPVTVKIDARVLDAGNPAAASAALAAALPALITDLGAGTVRMTHAIANNLPVRAMPADFLATEWQLQIETQSAVQGVILATTAKETA